MHARDIRHRLEEGVKIFSRIFLIYEAASKKPLRVGNRLLGPSTLHVIEAIGKNRAATITALSGHAMVTKGAISQIVTKLTADGLVKKTRQGHNRRETPLELTPKGRAAFEAHERHAAPTLDKLRRIMRERPKEEIDAFLRVLAEVEDAFGDDARK